MDDRLVVGWIFIAIAVLALLLMGVPALRRWQRARSAERVELGRGLRGGGEYVAVEGTAQALDGEETVASPLEERECLAYTYRVQERRRRGGKSRGSRWVTIESDEATVPFELDDGTGRVAVRPQEPTLLLSKRRTRQNHGRTRGVRVGSVRFGTRRQRHTETRLEPGDFCCVVGQMQAATEGGGHREIVPTNDGTALVIGDRPYRSVLRRLLGRALLMSLFALVFGGFGAVALLDYYGIVEVGFETG